MALIICRGKISLNYILMKTIEKCPFLKYFELFFKCTIYFYVSYSAYSEKLLKICTLIIYIPNFLYISVFVDLSNIACFIEHKGIVN